MTSKFDYDVERRWALGSLKLDMRTELPNIMISNAKPEFNSWAGYDVHGVQV